MLAGGLALEALRGKSLSLPFAAFIFLFNFFLFSFFFFLEPSNALSSQTSDQIQMQWQRILNPLVQVGDGTCITVLQICRLSSCAIDGTSGHPYSLAWGCFLCLQRTSLQSLLLSPLTLPESLLKGPLWWHGSHTDICPTSWFDLICCCFCHMKYIHRFWG